MRIMYRCCARLDVHKETVRCCVCRVEPDCGSRKLDLRALGYGTTRFSDPAQQARTVAEGSGV
jgi:hypothetical protein